MKIFIIAAITADGFIAKNSDHPAIWTSKADKKRFVELTKRAGVMIMGSSTYKTIGRPLKDRLTIVYSKSQKFDGVEMTNSDPIDLIKDLEKRGYKEIAICGGANIYSMFMKAKVVDTIYLTIEPILFGKGMNIFNDELDFKLTLRNVESIKESDSILLEYGVAFS